MDLKLNNNDLLTMPLDFRQISYIESDGTQAISTGIVLNDIEHSTTPIKIDATLEILECSNNAIIYGTNAGSATRGEFRLWCNGTDNTSFKVLAYGLPTVASVIKTVSFSGKTHIVHTKGSIEINGVSTSIPVSGGNINYSTQFSIGFLNQSAKVKVYDFKIYKGTTLVIHYIPIISDQVGHIGEACLYDTVGNTYKYSSANGTFTPSAPNSLAQVMTTAYIKDCPNIFSIELLRSCANLNRVRLNLGEVSSTIGELLKYASYNGFNDNYEEQTKPRLVGTWNVTDYYTSDESSYVQSTIDGLNITYDLNKNVNALLENDELAVQSLDSTKPNYNPEVSTVLYNNNIGHTINNPINNEEGTYFLLKSDAAAATSLALGTFRNNTTITSFNEFKYWIGLTTITAGTGTAATTVGAFGLCTLLESIEIPEGVTTIGAYAFYGCSALNKVTIPSTLTNTGDYCFSNCLAMVDVGKVYYNGTLEQWMNITFNVTDVGRASSPMGQGSHFYLNGEELTQLTIPSGTTTIKGKTFHGFKYLTGNLVIPNTVTSIGTSAFRGCSGLTGDVILNNVTSVGVSAFQGCTGITRFENHTLCSYGNYFLKGCTGINSVVIINNSSNVGASCFGIGSSSSPVELLSCKNWGLNSGSSDTNAYVKKIVINGNLVTTIGLPMRSLQKLYVSGNITSCSSMGQAYNSNGTYKFLEAMGNITPTGSNEYQFYGGSNQVAHFGYNGVITSKPNNIKSGFISLGLVGDGTSKSSDESILALYLANSNWSGQSARLGTWWDYNGTYKWYRVTDTLTNCTNTNPVVWPFIDRKSSYETTIVADEGYTLDSVQVLMYQCQDNTATPDNPTDITSDVYDPTTGAVNIQSVTGNIIITATAVSN